MEVNQIVSNLLGSNTYVLKKGNNSIIIDAGAGLNQVIPYTNGTNVLAVLLTHLHFDHCYNISSYVSKFNCPVYLFNKNNVTNNNFTLQQMFEKFELPKNCYNNLEGVTNLKLNNFNISCFHTPGHSADSMCFKIEDNLFSGDMLFYYSIGRTDLLTSNKLDMLNSLEMLKKINFSVCYSGHGQSSTYAEQQENITYFLLEL